MWIFLTLSVNFQGPTQLRRWGGYLRLTAKEMGFMMKRLTRNSWGFFYLVIQGQWNTKYQISDRIQRHSSHRTWRYSIFPFLFKVNFMILTPNAWSLLFYHHSIKYSHLQALYAFDTEMQEIKDFICLEVVWCYDTLLSKTKP